MPITVIEFTKKLILSIALEYDNYIDRIHRFTIKNYAAPFMVKYSSMIDKEEQLRYIASEKERVIDDKYKYKLGDYYYLMSKGYVLKEILKEKLKDITEEEAKNFTDNFMQEILTSDTKDEMREAALHTVLQPSYSEEDKNAAIELLSDEHFFEKEVPDIEFTKYQIDMMDILARKEYIDMLKSYEIKLKKPIEEKEEELEEDVAGNEGTIAQKVLVFMLLNKFHKFGDSLSRIDLARFINSLINKKQRTVYNCIEKYIAYEVIHQTERQNIIDFQWARKQFEMLKRDDIIEMIDKKIAYLENFIKK